MGRDWYLGGGKSSSSTAATSKRDRDSNHTASTSTPSGCLSAVFHFFDFHHFPFPLHHHSASGDTSISQKPHSFQPQEPVNGIEAPRNSLELEEGKKSSTSLPSISKEENINIPSLGIQIKTRGDTRGRLEAPKNEFSSEIISSPATKTPTLVARLMGLDLIPESNQLPAPSSTPKSLHHHLQPRKPLHTKHRNSLDGDIIGTRSLPETPRISAARRSDVDLHHRLSLQINKENISPSEELVLSRLGALKRKELKNEDENRSPGHYARQIVKQVKESVGRKVGMNITNTVRNREVAREELVNQFKAQKISKALAKVADQSSPGKHSAPSCSSRLRFLEPKSKPGVSTPPPEVQPHNIKIFPAKPKLQPVQEKQEQQQEELPIKKCKKYTGGRFSPRLKKPVQEETFVRPANVSTPDRKCKKTPLSNDLLNISVPTLLPVKKDHSSSSPATKFSQKQIAEAQTSKQSSQLSSCSSQTYKQQETHPHPVRGDHRNKCNGAATATFAGVDGAAHEYITGILKCTGIDQDTPVSFTRWFSPSHPLDPSIFYFIEHFNATRAAVPCKNSASLRHRCNRKLLFHLVDEILVEILKPFFNTKPWVSSIKSTHHMRGSELIETLCSKIRRFPQADCRVLEDIDGLIEEDFPEMKLQTAAAYEEEGEDIAAEIERDILEELAHETAVAMRV
ncbi:hypothetical protein SLEP1_g3619 [Rubroshorea leprosula]|uniref:DUF4378 domain-containing protein n=1 Tax=Rubroshorea leprosula TaxID=152421 RepID=A0AAV5HWT4_9ROSI|nr:hypothetical protein SLEP1_g3619 [Rubroshorea leprosula]